MTIVCPAILAENKADYNRQLKDTAKFAKRVHLDLMDGIFTSSKSPKLSDIVVPNNLQLDIHVMFQNPSAELPAIIELKPSLVIVHAEADGHFVEIARELHRHGIKAGVALLPETPVDTIEPALDAIDHVLVFSGDLGHFGGEADLTLMDKAEWCKEMKPSIEVGWDGGVDDSNAFKLAEGGVDVLNVGGYIQKSQNPKGSYQRLQNLLH